MSPQAFIGFGLGLVLGVCFMGLSALSPFQSKADSIETQARQQGMIYSDECRVNWGQAFDSDENTQEIN